MSERVTITRVLVYRDSAGEWRFTCYAANNEAILVSSEGYKDHRYAVKLAGDLFPDATINEQTGEPTS